jgi:hypothetical protein
VYTFCVEPAAIKHGSATRSQSVGGIATVKVCRQGCTLDLRGRSACMLRDESMSLPKQRDTPVLSKRRVDA